MRKIFKKLEKTLKFLLSVPLQVQTSGNGTVAGVAKMQKILLRHPKVSLMLDVN
jgi:hypothetical protein